jgi:Predicted exonuclease
VIDSATTLARRLERYRSATRPPVSHSATAAGGGDLAIRLADALDGEIVRSPEGVIVRCEAPTRPLSVDRARLATLPGQPARDTPLVCLDTETTGLATAAGTVAFLIGLGWWESDRFRQVQLLLPDHGEERALLTALEMAIPASAWLVTYNGRGFDWPLLVARYRLARRPAPAHAGHLDLLPIVRRIFRHRMPDARLRTAETELLGLHRVGDVEGWEIPGRYLGFLRGDPAEGLVEVVRHNDQDVRSLGRLLAHLEGRLGDPARRSEASPGDLAGLARAFAREHRLREALECLDAAADRPVEVAPGHGSSTTTATRSLSGEASWWSPRHPADFGGRPPRAGTRRPSMSSRGGSIHEPWTIERIAVDRAHVLRRIGRHAEAAEAWTTLAAGPGRTAIVAAIELAKIHEHRMHDKPSALAAAIRGLGAIERRRRLGRPEPALEADLVRRVARLRPRPLRVGRADLRCLARDDRAADPFPAPADQHGRPIRNAGQAGTLHGK